MKYKVQGDYVIVIRHICKATYSSPCPVRLLGSFHEKKRGEPTTSVLSFSYYIGSVGGLNGFEIKRLFHLSDSLFKSLKTRAECNDEKQPNNKNKRNAD